MLGSEMGGGKGYWMGGGEFLAQNELWEGVSMRKEGQEGVVLTLAIRPPTALHTFHCW